MKIEVDHDEMCPVIKEVYSGAFLETSEQNRIGFCMRDDTVEFNVIPHGSGKSQWFRVNMQTLEVEKMGHEDETPVRDPESVHNAG
jgi:hypothetical protein